MGAGVLALAGLTLTGCGGVHATGGDDYQTRRQLSLIAELYGDYLQNYNGPPKDEAAFSTAF